MTVQKKPAAKKNVERKRVLQPKVTVLSVRREWEQKYEELSNRYAELARAHMDLAKRADDHRDAEQHYAQLAETRYVEINRCQGVIIYLENKIGELIGTSSD